MLARSMPRVLIVGAGATGSCAALRLKRCLGKDVIIEVWEKARGPGGRMSTNRSDTPGVNMRADMGAQYLSLDGSHSACEEVAELLVKAGICADVQASVLSSTPERTGGESWRHLAGTAGGVNDALKKLLEDSGATPHYEKRVSSLDEQQGQWCVRPFQGSSDYFDAVILAVPGCGVGGDNLNKIRGNYEGYFTKEQNRQLSSVQHDARWSFAFYLPSSCAAKCDEYFGATVVETVVDDNTIHLLCYQSRKSMHSSGSAQEGGVVIVAHTTTDWASRNARANGRDQRILSEVADKVGQTLKLDGSLSRTMLGSKVITWKQSQVTRPVPEGPDGFCMLASTSPALALAGDYFTDSSFGGCLKSGFAAADSVAHFLLNGKGQSPGRNPRPALEGESGKSEGRKGKGKGTGRQHVPSADGAYGKKGSSKGTGKQGYPRQPYSGAW